jgi:hypothetical protein
LWKRNEEMVRSTDGLLPWRWKLSKGNDNLGHPS